MAENNNASQLNMEELERRIEALEANQNGGKVKKSRKVKRAEKKQAKQAKKANAIKVKKARKPKKALRIIIPIALAGAIAALFGIGIPQAIYKNYCDKRAAKNQAMSDFFREQNELYDPNYYENVPEVESETVGYTR